MRSGGGRGGIAWITLRPSCSRHGAPRPVWCDEEWDNEGKWDGHCASALSSNKRQAAKHCAAKRRAAAVAAAHGLGPENHVLPPHAPSRHAYPERAAAARVRLRKNFLGKAARTVACVTSRRRQPSECCGNTGPQRNRLLLLNLTLVSLFF